MRNPPVIDQCDRIVSGISEVTDRFCNPDNEGNPGSRGVPRDPAGYRHGQSMAMDSPRPWTVHDHGQSMAMDCLWPWTVHIHGLSIAHYITLYNTI